MAPWVFTVIVNRPPLVTWAAFADLGRRFRLTTPLEVSRTASVTLVGGRTLQVRAERPGPAARPPPAAASGRPRVLT